jgi:hypothetical protein
MGVAICCLALGCGRNRGTIRINDVTTTNVLTLVSGYSGISNDIPSGISLRVYGQLDGTAFVYGEEWEPVTITGAVDWSVYHDWFEPSCVLYYAPQNVRSGHLKVSYTFH